MQAAQATVRLIGVRGLARLRGPPVPLEGARESIQAVGKLGGWNRAAYEVALRGVAAERGHEVQRVLCFHSLRHDPQSERVGEVYGRAHDRQRFGVPGDPGKEAPVELQLVDGKLPEVGKRREPRSVVVHRDPDTHPLEAPQHIDREVGIGHKGRLGDLDGETGRRDPLPPQQRRDFVGQPLVPQVGCRGVDGDVEFQALCRPACLLLQRLVENVHGEGVDEAGVLGQPHEPVRSQQPVLGMLPPDEGFDRVHGPGRQVELGLVVQDQLVPGQRARKLGQELEPLPGMDVAARRVQLPAMMVALGLIHGHVGLLQQHLGGRAVLRANSDADAGVHAHAHPGDHHRLRQRLADPVRQPGGVGDIGQRPDDNPELVPAEPGERSGLAHDRAEAGRELAQHIVADLVAEAVVDLLEPVEINHEHGEFRRAAPLVNERLQLLKEEPAV
jgi:hypothetical protein